MTLLATLVATSRQVAKTSARSAKIRLLADCLRLLDAEELEIAVTWLSGEIRQRRMGIGPSALRANIAEAAVVPTLKLSEVDRALGELKEIRGDGSTARRAAALRALFGRATREEQPFLLQLLAGELRQGALTGVMTDAIAAITELPVAEVRRAAMYEANLGVIARTARELVLDGEAIAFTANGRPHAFQTTMRRFGRKLDVEKLRAELPIRAYFFDCLRRDEAALAERPTRVRFAALAEVVPSSMLIPRRITRSGEEATAFYDDAIAQGHQGLMAKSLDSPYEAGNRGAGWLKIKRAHTLDLVVLAAEWGHGRRTGKLSNLHLGALDTVTGQTR